MENEWKKLLRRKATASHMCEENRTALGQVETKADAIALYIQTIDWALEEDYPGLNVIRRYFQDCEQYGIFVDKTFSGETLIDLPVYVFHNCKGSIRVGLNTSKRIIPMLYFANGCDMTITSSNTLGLRSRVPLYVFGDNTVIAESSEDIICRTYNFDVK